MLSCLFKYVFVSIELSIRNRDIARPSNILLARLFFFFFFFFFSN